MKNAIALVPGFIGFEHRGDQPLWVDRFAAALQARAEAECGERVRIFPIPTLPIGSLSQRQTELMKVLHVLDQQGGPYQWHLVGHSTGGVDAALLARRTRLAYVIGKGSRFTNEPLDLHLDLGSVTTLSAPHYGTCLALSPVATMTHGEGATRGAVHELWDGLCSLGQRDALLERMHFAVGAGLHGTTLQFLAHLLLGNELAIDLRPEVAGRLAEADNRRDDVPLFCLATVAPPPAARHGDRLYANLWGWTQEAADAALPAPSLRPEAGSVIAGPTRIPTTIAPRDNDGVVNTERQVLPGAFAGLVVADHGDVIGRYRRKDHFDQRMIDPGLLTSGARFGDDQFFEVIARIAEGIVSVIGDTPRRSHKGTAGVGSNPQPPVAVS